LGLNLRDILNKLLWDQRENTADYELTFIHRGAPTNVKVIRCDSITEVKASWFVYGDERGETTIPFHRILTIKNAKTGQSAWERKR
jgi:uncharacterized protein (UPF0248 family)